MNRRVNRMRGEFGNLSGSIFQRRAANFAARPARRDSAAARPNRPAENVRQL